MGRLRSTRCSYYRIYVIEWIFIPCQCLLYILRYATIVRDSRRLREREFLKKVHECVAMGGKVLIPVFALGRSQELCLLIESYWERLSLDVPVYFSAGLTEKANHYYRLYLQWTNQMIRTSLNERNIFEFKHIKTFERHMADQPGPMVLFASPGMLHSGMNYCKLPLFVFCYLIIRYIFGCI